MILSASNIAWAPEERLAAYEMMAEANFVGLEIAPGLFFSKATDSFVPDDVTAQAAISELAAFGLSLVSMQSLLFGVEGAALFGDAAEHASFVQGMIRAINLAGRYGIPNLVFGSPGNRRIPEDLSLNDAWARAADTFHYLGDHAAAVGTSIAMETNPVAYGTNFLTTLEETEAFVAQVDHAAVTLILDLGAMHMNGVYGDLAGRAKEVVTRLTHVHISEPYLAPAPDDSTKLAPVLSALRDAGYAGAASIEMKRPEGGVTSLRDRFAALARAAMLEASA